MRRPCLLFALGPELVAVQGVAIEIMDRPEHLGVVQARAGIDVVHGQVGLAALEDVQVSILVDIAQHLVAAAVVALTVAVKAHVDRQGVKLLLGLVVQVPVGLGHQLVVVLGVAYVLRHLALVGLVDRLLVGRVVLGGQHKHLPNRRLLLERAGAVGHRLIGMAEHLLGVGVRRLVCSGVAAAYEFADPRILRWLRNAASW